MAGGKEGPPPVTPNAAGPDRVNDNNSSYNNNNNMYILHFTSALVGTGICTYMHTYIHTCIHACMHTYIHIMSEPERARPLEALAVQAGLRAVLGLARRSGEDGDPPACIRGTTFGYGEIRETPQNPNPSEPP